MAIMKALVIDDCWEFDEPDESSKDAMANALVCVDGESVTITPHESDQAVRVAFTREEWLEITKLVNSVPAPVIIEKGGGK